MSAGLDYHRNLPGVLTQSVPTWRTRPDLCAEHGHPGVTYNPWMGKTWCLCGDVVRDGNHHTHADCCGGPLTELIGGDA